MLGSRRCLDFQLEDGLLDTPASWVGCKPAQTILDTISERWTNQGETESEVKACARVLCGASTRSRLATSFKCS